MLAKTAPKKNNPSMGLLPVNHDSCFGNFPTESRPKAKRLVVDNMNLNMAEQSTAIAPKTSKLINNR